MNSLSWVPAPAASEFFADAREALEETQDSDLPTFGRWVVTDAATRH